MILIVVSSMFAVVGRIADTTADIGKRKEVFSIICRGIPP